MRTEQWRPVDTITDISSAGRVRQKVHGNKTIYKKQHENNGRKFVAFREDGRQVNKFVHRLVAEAFLPNPRGYHHVIFKDGDVGNPHAANLAWSRHPQPETCPGSNPATDESDREEIARRLNAGDRGVDIARDFGISPALVSRIKHGL